MKKSWIKKTALLLTSIIIVLYSALVFIMATYRKEIEASIISGNKTCLQIQAAIMDDKLRMLQEHIHNLLVDLYTTTSFANNNEQLDYTKLKLLYDDMDSRLFVSDEADAFFMYDINTKQYLVRTTSSLTIMEKLNLKNWILDNCVMYSSTLQNPKWKIIDVEGKCYYVKAIQMGKYIMGAASAVGHYPLDSTISVNGITPSLFTANSEDNYYLNSGSNEYIDYLDKEEREGVFNKIAVTSYQPTGVDGSIVLITTLQAEDYSYTRILACCIVCILISSVLVIYVLYYLNKSVSQQTKKLITATHEVAQGNLDYSVDEQHVDSKEFYDLYHSFNAMEQQIKTLKIASYDMQIEQEKNKLRMLRAQVRPHTFLNQITTISNMTYTHKPEEIRTYLNSFAKFARYMLHISDEWTTIGEELNHVENYVRLQQAKSPYPIDFDFYCPDELKGIKMPILMLHSLVENSFKHSLTLTEDDTEIIIYVEQVISDDFTGVKCTVEDNGRGFSDEALSQLEEAFKQENLFAKEHIGLTNIIYTMKLLYHREDLLRVSNREFGGARVELFIPKEGEGNETIGM